MREVAYVNGQYVDRAKAMVHIEDRALQFGDGVYEVVKFYGRRPLRLIPHLERLQRSCDAMRFQNAPTTADWQQIISRLVDETDLSLDASQPTILYLQVTRGATPRVHGFPKVAPPPGVIAHFRLSPSYTPEQRRDGLALSTQPDERWCRCFIKSTCLLPSVLAKQAAIEAGAFEAVLVRNGVVTEGAATNIFCVRNGIVYTHPEGECILSGVTRQLVLEAAQQAGVEVRQEAVSIEDFRGADEVFLSSTTMDVMPATQLDGAPVGPGMPGPVTLRIARAVQAIIDEEVGGPAAGGSQ